MEGVNAIAHVLQTHVELHLYILAVQYLNIIMSDSIFFHFSLDICPPNLYDIVIGFHFAVWIKACTYREAFLPLSNRQTFPVRSGNNKWEWQLFSTSVQKVSHLKATIRWREDFRRSTLHNNISGSGGRSETVSPTDKRASHA